MMREHFGAFLRNEDGGGTIWGLCWFFIFVAMAGLSMDITDGFRARTMLQATADASALAGVIDTPDRDAAVASAVTYSALNMGTDQNGTVLAPEDVIVGKWISETKSIDPTDPLPDAVKVTVWRGAENNNALPVNFLRIVGLTAWNVQAQAVAQRFLPNCLRQDGLIAAGVVDISSNNTFVGEICFHGEQGVDIQSNNYFEDGTVVSMIDLNDLSLPASGMDTNPGLPEALMAERLYPKMVDMLDEIMDDYLSPSTSKWLPDYIDKTQDVITVTRISNYDYTTLEPGRVYHFACPSERNNMQINGVEIHHVVIVADCVISFGEGAYIHDARIASRAAADLRNQNQATQDRLRELAGISTASSATLGTPDNCAEGGSIQILSNSSMSYSSGTTMDGVQMVAKNDIILGARDGGINGISAQAGGNIYLTSQNAFGLCQDNTGAVQTAWFYRLVQ